MSEATLQAALIAALSGVVRDGSILVNDYQTPQVASRDYAPWLILEAADDVTMTTGASYTTPGNTMGVCTYPCLPIAAGGMTKTTPTHFRRYARTC
jgi:hypothetical protein